MLRTVGARFAQLLMAGGARLSVATAPRAEWPLDHTTDECQRCRDHLVVTEAELRGLLIQARSGVSADRLVVDVRAAERNVELVGLWEMLDAS